MGDRHGGRFARRGRTLNPPHPHIDAHRGVGFRWRARAKEFAPREKALLGEGLPTRRTSEGICPTRERSPRRRHPDTAHGRRDLPRAGTLSSAKASRHGARAKGFARAGTRPSAKALPTRREGEGICPREKALLGESLPTRREGEGICPRRNTPHGEGLPTRRTSERICPAQELAPRRRPPDTARRRKDLPRAGTLPTAKASRHGARAKGFAPRGSRLSHVPTNGGPPTTDGQPKNTPSAGSHPQRAAAAEFIHRKKIRLLHETQLFYGESHVDSRQIFPSFPSVGRCVARERNPVPPVAPHRGSEPRGLRRTGERMRRFDAMCPRGGEWLPRGGNGWPCGGRCYPGIRCFGERFHRRRCANPDACRGRRCARAHDDLGQRAFRSARPTFRNPLCDSEKTCGGRRCARG